jgi:hypothetical protein
LQETLIHEKIVWTPLLFVLTESARVKSRILGWILVIGGFAILLERKSVLVRVQSCCKCYFFAAVLSQRAMVLVGKVPKNCGVLQSIALPNRVQSWCKSIGSHYTHHMLLSFGQDELWLFLSIVSFVGLHSELSSTYTSISLCLQQTACKISAYSPIDNFLTGQDVGFGKVEYLT